MQEVMRVPYGKIYEATALPADCQADARAMRVVHNIIPAARLRLFSQVVYRLLCAVSTVPYDLEVHQGEGIPLHAHLNVRRYVYANIGGTFNSPTDLAENVIPPTRDMVQQLARQMAAPG